MHLKRHSFRWALIFASVCVLAAPGHAQTVIKPGPSSFIGTGTISMTGTTGSATYTIPANVGQQRGANLFDSFSQFDIAQGDTAKFTDANMPTPTMINNIIARIYSATPSQINGNILVDTTGMLKSANLFLINPNGVIFGSGSSVSVPGNFVASTANYTILGDGTGVFYSDPTNPASGADNMLTSDPVSAFGFFKGTTPALITVNSGANFTGVGGSLQFAGGDFTATGGTNLTVSSSLLGIFSGGQVNSNTDASVPYLTGGVTTYTSETNFNTHGTVTLGTAGTSGTGATLAAGSVVIRGGHLVQVGLGGSISASGSVAIKGDSLTVTNGTISATSNNGTVGIDTSAPDTTGTDTTGTITLNTSTITAKGGAISLTTGSIGDITLDSASSIAEASGHGGTLSITSTGTVTNAGTISTVGSSDPLQISALALAVTGTISTGSTALGIDTTADAALTNGGTITSAGGSITIGGTSLVDLSVDGTSSITETTGAGGNLTINATGTVTNGGTISTTSSGQDIAISAQSVSLTGTISTVKGALGIDTAQDITLTGGSITSQAGQITLGATSLRNLMLDGTSSITETTAHGGTLTISASGTITNAGTISTSGTVNALAISAKVIGLSGTFSTDSGAINVDSTGTTTLTSGGGITSNGNITLGQSNLGALALNTNSSIVSTGNNVSITATGNVSFTGGTINATGGGATTVNSSGNIVMTGGTIETTTTNGTTGGALSVTDSAGAITLTQGAQIVTVATNSGQAGNVTVNGGVLTSHGNTTTLTITGTGVAAFSNSTQTGQTAFDSGSGTEAPNTGIFSMASGSGNAGSVNVTATGSTAITAGGQIASIQSNASGGNAGAVSLTVDPDTFFESATVNTLTLGGVTTASGATAVPIIPVIYASTANPMSSTGNIAVNALSSSIELQPGAAIQTSTQDGRAGDITIFTGALTLDSYSDIQSLMSQTSSTDTSTSGRTGDILIEAFNFNFDFLSPNFGFTGPISIASNAFIQTVANPRLANAANFSSSPVGNVTIYAGSLSEGGMVVPVDADGFDYDYQITDDTLILTSNNATLNGANGTDAAGSVTPLVEDLIGFPSNPTSTTIPAPPPGLGIVLDGTLNGSRDGQLTTIMPTNTSPTYLYLIDESDGTLSGGNLFLSFAQFDLGVNHPDSTDLAKTGFVSEAVEFIAPGVKNILARITDGNPSDINGEIEEQTGTNANIFFFNPAGIVFGNHATLAIGGALTLSTADAVEMNGTGTDNSGLFSTHLGTGDDAVLTPTSTSFSNYVQDFQFNTDTPGSVTISSKLITKNGGNGQLQVIAGPVNLTSAFLDASQTLLFSTASSGTLTFASNNSLGTFPADFTSASQIMTYTGTGGATPTLGTVAITGGTVITVPSPNNASTILVRANEFDLTNSLIVDQTTGQSNSLAGQVLIDVTGPANILTSSTQNSFISTSTLGASNGGSVRINAASLTITGGQGNIATTGIFSTAQPANYYSSDVGYAPYNYSNPAQGLDPSMATGNAGSITLNIGGTVMLNTFAQISASTSGYGKAGTITITGPTGSAPEVTISGGASITSSTFIDPNNHGEFTSTGDAGTVSLTASSLLVTGTQTLIATSAGTAVDTTSPTGNGGNITITVDGSTGAGTGDIVITSSGQISGSSFTNGQAGTVTISQANSADLVDPSTNPTTNGGLYINGGTISTAANGAGTATQTNMNAGNITLNTQGLTLTGNTSSITSSTEGASKAGDITVNGPSGNAQTQFIIVENGGTIASDTGGLLGNGGGGAIVLNTGGVTVNGAGSAISTSSTGGSGGGGSIMLNVAGTAGVAGSTGDVAIANSGTISASSDATGAAGTVTISQSDSFDLTSPTSTGGIYVNGGTISTAANGAGVAGGSPGPGNITLNTQELTMNGGDITSSTNGASKAGDITVNSPSSASQTQFVVVENGGTIASNTGGALGNGAGGAIVLNTGAVTVSGAGSAISTSSTGGSGGGGSILLNVAGAAGIAGSTGDVAIENSGTISASSDATGAAGTVTISQAGSSDLAATGGIYVDGGTISTAANGAGVAGGSPGPGNITLNTQVLTLNGGDITSSTNGASKAGDITVNGTPGSAQTQFVIVENGGTIESNTGGLHGNGGGGAIVLNTGALTVNGTGSAISTSSTGGSGGGGSIMLNVTGALGVMGSTGDVAITNGGTISASSDATGDAGTVTITQSGSMDITNPAISPTSNGGLYLDDGVITTAANGIGTVTPNANAGNIALNVQALTLTDGALVLSSTSGLSKAGDVTIGGAVGGTNTEFVMLQDGAQIESETGGTNGSGAGGTITIGTALLVVDGAGISTSTTAGIGQAGDIAISAVADTTTKTSSVAVLDGGTIMSESADSGSAGMISILADTLAVTDAGSAISTDAGTVGAVGNSKGEIMLTGKDLTISQSGLISATTGGLSPGGTITVTASDAVALSLLGRMDASSTSGTNGGNGGSILIGADPTSLLPGYGITSPLTVTLTGHSEISCDSQNTNGGNIGITTQQLTMDSSLISTNEPNGAATTLGGDISIKAGQIFYLNDYSFIDSNAGQGTGGNIHVDPEFTVLNHSGISAAGGTSNGNVVIDSSYVLSSTSFIVATGTVSIDSLPLDLTGSLLPLPADLSSEEKRLREKCARAVNHEFSSFIVVGRGGTESGPDELQPDFGL